MANLFRDETYARSLPGGGGEFKEMHGSG